MSNLTDVDSVLISSDIDSILKSVRESRPSENLKDREAAARREEILSEFLRQQTFPNAVDYYCSLVLLHARSGWRLTGHLNVSPELERLPLIERTGIREPFMHGHLLGFDDDAITDPDLQRARSLCFSTAASYQDWIHLLLRILQGAGTGLKFPQDNELVEADVNASQVGELREIFKEAIRLVGREPKRRAAAAGASAGAGTNSPESQSLPQRLSARAIAMFSGATHAPCPAHWHAYLERRLAKWKKKPRGDGISQPLLTNLCKALLLSMRKTSYDARHLGQNRLNAVAQHTAQNIVISGVGDLSMNPWNIAFYRDDKHPDGEIFIPFKEPSASRTYNCLVVWKRNPDAAQQEQISNVIAEIQGTDDRSSVGITVGSDLGITELQISKVPPKLRLARRPRIELDSITDFALYGKLVLREGRIVPGVDAVEEFQDLRHLFWLPNINPSDKDIAKYLKRYMLDHVLDEDHRHKFMADNIPPEVWLQQFGKLQRNHFKRADDVADPTMRFFVAHWELLRRLLLRPRNIFNEYRAADVWLLEKALLEIRNLKHLACSSAIVVGLDELGAPAEWIELSLRLWGYQPKSRGSEVEASGDFYWDRTAKEKPMLHIRLLPSRYPITMIGIGSPQRHYAHDMRAVDTIADTLYLLAWGHDFQYARHSVWDCAEVLRAAGASYAMVVDEGQDVFQFLIRNRTELNSDFSKAEQFCEPLDRFARVPIAYSEDGEKLLRRTGSRASLALWQYQGA